MLSPRTVDSANTYGPKSFHIFYRRKYKTFNVRDSTISVYKPRSFRVAAWAMWTDLVLVGCLDTMFKYSYGPLAHSDIGVAIRHPDHTYPQDASTKRVLSDSALVGGSYLPSTSTASPGPIIGEEIEKEAHDPTTAIPYPSGALVLGVSAAETSAHHART